jgi:hypothetical protein
MLRVDPTGFDATTSLGAAPTVAPGEPPFVLESTDSLAWRVRWAGHDPLQVGVYAAAYHVVPVNNLGARVGALSAAPVAVHPNDTTVFSVAADALVQDPQSAATVHVNLPPSYRLAQAVLWEASADPSPNAYAPFTLSSESLDIPLLLPRAGHPLGLTIEASTEGNARTDVFVALASEGPTVVDVPAAPTPLSPESDATDVGAGTELRWTPIAGAATYAYVYDGNGGPTPTILIAAPNGVGRLPDLSRIGVPLPSGARLAWTPMAITPGGSVDDLARTGANPPLTTAYMTAVGDVREFVTR